MKSRSIVRSNVASANPHEKTMHSIDLFGRYVIPHFRNQTPSVSVGAGQN